MSFEDRMDEKKFKKRKIEKLTEPITMELLFGEVIGLRRDIFEINKRQKENEDTIDRVENMLDQGIGFMIVELQKDVKSISDTVDNIEDNIIDIDVITEKIDEFEEKTMKKFSEIENTCDDIDRNIDNINCAIADVENNTINISKHFGVKIESSEDENKDEKINQLQDYKSMKAHMDIYSTENGIRPELLESYSGTLSDLKKKYDSTFLDNDPEYIELKNMKFLAHPSQENFIKEFGVHGADIYKALVEYKMKN
jgi:predicted  nucleic acid-binding Zn-ribbon protein